MRLDDGLYPDEEHAGLDGKVLMEPQLKMPVVVFRWRLIPPVAF
ncbi:MAG: hypothetical protein R3C11_25505 [Planctomycetaceae bacterium]